MSPLFSIGITTYDREKMLCETLNSIAMQTFGDYEVIVSNDNPKRKISAQSIGICDPRFKFINQENNLGEPSNMNYLLRESFGRYFTWVADDDLYSPEFLESVYKTLVKYSFPECVFTSFSIFKKEAPFIESGNIINGDKLLSGNEFLYRYSKGKIKAISVMGLFERKAIQKIGGIEDISGDGNCLFSEYMLFVRSGMLDKVVYINRPLVLYRVHDQSWGNSTIELKTYRSGAKNLADQCIAIFKGHGFKNHFYAYLYSILKIVILENLAVMSRRKSLGDKSFRKIAVYLISTRGYIDTLKGSKLYLIGLTALIHAEINIGLFLIGSMIRKRLWRKCQLESD